MNAAKQLALAAEALHACGFRGRANKLRRVADELALTEAAFDGIHAQLAALSTERDALAAFAQGLQVATDSLRAERDALAAKVERVRDWLDHRGVDTSDRDGAYMNGYRAAQRHMVLDAAELRAALDEEAQP